MKLWFCSRVASLVSDAQLLIWLHLLLLNKHRHGMAWSHALLSAASCASKLCWNCQLLSRSYWHSVLPEVPQSLANILCLQHCTRPLFARRMKSFLRGIQMCSSLTSSTAASRTAPSTLPTIFASMPVLNATTLDSQMTPTSKIFMVHYLQGAEPSEEDVSSYFIYFSPYP